MTLAIRPSRPEDIPEIAAIYAHAVLHGTASFEIDPPDRAEMARRRLALVEAGLPYLVAEEEDRVLGYA
jgi:phosphinothricin acetyltransferase